MAIVARDFRGALSFGARLLLQAETSLFTEFNKGKCSDDGYQLRHYYLEDGRAFFEAVQDTTNDRDQSLIFIALKDRSGNWVNASLWTPEERIIMYSVYETYMEDRDEDFKD